MSKYRIGITEGGDAGIDLRWSLKMPSVDAAVLVTKDCSENLRLIVMSNPDKFLIHATTTGYGGTAIEPNVPRPDVQIQKVRQLIDAGFPSEKIVARIDPIIPTSKGIQIAGDIIDRFFPIGVRRFRVSVLDIYPHVRERFKKHGIELPYGDAFSASDEQFQAVDDMLRLHKSRKPGIQFECCAEPKLKVPFHCGCISEYDLELLGLSEDDGDFSGYQRRDCLCYSGKVELLGRKHPCGHGCLYCYWKD